MRNRWIAVLFLALLLAGCGSVLVSVEPVPFQYEPLNIPPDPPAKPTDVPAPDSPLAVPAAAVLLTGASPDTFGLGELEAAADEAGVLLLPGSYTCEIAPDGNYLACEIASDGVPGGAICVTAAGWGACE